MSLIPYPPSISKVLKAELKRIIVECLVEGSAFQTCITCQHFSEDVEKCSKFENVRPPARVLAFGCSFYLEDESK